jgi:hypothetical protein
VVVPELTAEGAPLAVFEEGDKAGGRTSRATVRPGGIFQTVLQIIALLDDLMITEVVVFYPFGGMTEQ